MNSSKSQSQSQYQSLPYTEITPENILENNIRIELDDNDYFLKGFLIGYKREKDRIQELRANKEEMIKKELIANIDGELRGIISEMISKEVKLQLEVMKPKEEKVEKKEDVDEVDDEKVEIEVIAEIHKEDEEDNEEEIKVENNDKEEEKEI